MIFQLLLAGFDEDTNETDHLVKWIKSPTEFAVEMFAVGLGLEGFTIEEATMLPPDVDFEDGLDVELDEGGAIIGTAPEIDPTTWREQSSWSASERPV